MTGAISISGTGGKASRGSGKSSSPFSSTLPFFPFPFLAGFVFTVSRSSFPTILIAGVFLSGVLVSASSSSNGIAGSAEVSGVFFFADLAVFFFPVPTGLNSAGACVVVSGGVWPAVFCSFFGASFLWMFFFFLFFFWNFFYRLCGFLLAIQKVLYCIQALRSLCTKAHPVLFPYPSRSTVCHQW